MKRLLTIFLVTFSILLSGSLVNKTSAQAGVEVSYQNFYDELSPYGQWIDYPEYGYVWVPNEGRDFRPYSSGGRWVWSDDYQWMWVSDYSWGWAPFHYGRWFEDPMYGWMWMPGYEWAPAWVAWRDGGDYYGWAPLRPGINISLGFSMGSYNPPIDYWCFAPRRYITSNRIGSYCLDRSRNVTIINNTTIINNYSRRSNVFVTGPGRRDAERYAGRITPVRFRESSRPGRAEFRNNRVSIYRPSIQRDENRRFAPRNYNNYDNNGRNNGNAIRNGNGNNTPGRRNVFDRNDNNDRPANNNGRVADRPANPSNNNGNRNNLPERRNVFDRNNSTDRPNDNNRGNNRNVERRNTEVSPPSSNPQPERRNVFDRPAQRQQQQPPQRVERPQQQRTVRPQIQPQQRTERPQQRQQPQRQQPQQRMERPQPQQRVERPQSPRSSGNESGGRRNVFDRHH